MSNSLALLGLSSRQASVLIVRELLKPTINPDYLDIGFPIVRDDDDIDVPVYGTTEAYQDPSWPYRGGAHIRYKRLDLSQTLGPLRPQVRVGPTYTTDQLTDYLGETLGIVFEPEDFYRENRTLSGLYERYLLRASPESPRWKGEVKILVHR